MILGARNDPLAIVRDSNGKNVIFVPSEAHVFSPHVAAPFLPSNALAGRIDSWRIQGQSTDIPILQRLIQTTPFHQV